MHLALDGVHVTTPDVDDEGAVVAVAPTVENDHARHARPCASTTEIVDADGTVVAREVAPLTRVPGASEVAARSGCSWRTSAVERRTTRRCTRAHVAVDDDGDCRARRRTTRRSASARLQLDPQRGLRINGEIGRSCAARASTTTTASSARHDRARRRAPGRDCSRTAGFNALRSAHHPMSRAMLDACDRLGMLVMDETFDMWTEPKTDDDYSHAFPDWWEADVDAMVVKDRNHPCVILYSHRQRDPRDRSTGRGRASGRAIAERIRALDDTRLVTNSINRMLVGRAPTCSRSLDGRGRRPTDRGHRHQHDDDDAGAVLPIMLQHDVVDRAHRASRTPTSTSRATTTPSRATRWTRAAPAPGDRRHRDPRRRRSPRTGQLVREHPHVIGDFTWTGWDYLGEAGIGRVEYGDASDDAPTGSCGEYPWLTAYCGDFDITGHRRPVSYYREIVFGPARTSRTSRCGRPQHHGEATRTGRRGRAPTPSRRGRGPASRAARHGRGLRRRRRGRAPARRQVGRPAPAGEGNGFRADFEVRTRPGRAGLAVASRGGVESGRTALRTAVGPLRIAAAVDREHIDATDTDLAYVSVWLTDVSGVIDTGADRAITVTIDGPATLQGFASADPRSLESYRSATSTTYEGRALAVIRPSGPGTITATFTADGLDVAARQITAT